MIAEDDQNTWDVLERSATSFKQYLDPVGLTTNDDEISYDKYGYFMHIWKKGIPLDRVKIYFVQHDGDFSYMVGDKKFKSAQSTILSILV